MPPSTLSSAVTLLSTSTCGVHILPPSNPPRFATYDFSETGEMTVNNSERKERKSTKMPTSGRLLSSTNHSMYMDDEPYSSEDDDVGITGAIVDGNQIEEFEESKLGGKKRREWTTEMDTVRGYNKVGEKELFTIFKTLCLTSLKISTIDEKAKSMFPSLTSLDLSTNAISDISNVPSTLISFSAYNNAISSLSTFPNVPDLMQLGLGYNPIEDGLSVLPSKLPNIISLDLAFCSLCDLNSTLSSLSSFKALRHLCLQGNPISLLPHYTFKTTSALSSLTILDDVTIDREPGEDDPKIDVDASEDITISCGVSKVMGIPVWTSEEKEEDDGGKSKKGGKGKDKGKKGKDKGKASATSLQTPEPVHTIKCFLQVTLKGVEHNFKEGESTDIRIADTPQVPWGPSLWSGDEEAEDGQKPGSAKGGKDKGKKGKKDKKGKGTAEPEEEASTPPPKNEGLMELKFAPTAEVRDAVMFGGLELVLWRISEDEMYELIGEETGEEKKDTEEKEAEETEPKQQPTITTTVSKDNMGRVMSTSISTSTMTREESGVTMKKDSIKTTVEVARGIVDLKYFLEQASLDKLGKGKLNLKGVLTLSDGFVQVEKDRINNEMKERRKKEKEEEGEVDPEGEEKAEEEEPNWQPEEIGVVEFDVEVKWNDVKEPEIVKVEEEGKVES